PDYEVQQDLTKGMIVHRHHGMLVLAHQRLALQADRAEAEGSTFGATGSDANMLRQESSPPIARSHRVRVRSLGPTRRCVAHHRPAGPGETADPPHRPGGSLG